MDDSKIKMEGMRVEETFGVLEDGLGVVIRELTCETCLKTETHWVDPEQETPREMMQQMTRFLDRHVQCLNRRN